MPQKRIYPTLIVASVLMTLAACNKSANDNAAQPNATTAATSAAAAPLSSVAVDLSPLTNTDLAAGTATAGHCALDAINDVTFTAGATLAKVEAGRSFTAAGWVVDSTMQSPPKFTLVLQGAKSFGVAGITGSSRPDVAKALNADAAGKSGFDITANLGATPPGTYKVLALIKGANNMELCDTQRQLVVGK